MVLQVVTNTGMQGSSGSLQPAISPISTVSPQKTTSSSTLQNTVGHSINQTPYVPYSAPQAPAPPKQYYYGDGTSAGYGSAGATAAREAAATAAYYDDMINQLRSQEGRLDRQFQVGVGNITNSYNQGYNRLGQQRAVAQRNYNAQTGQNTQSYLGARNGIMQNTRATANALQRLLGINGSGNSSAALEQAPYAAGLQGSTNLRGAQQTFSNNTNNLKMGWEDTERNYKNSVEDLNNQKYQQTNGLRASINQTRASLLDKIAQADINRRMAQGEGYDTARAARDSYQSRIDSLLDSIAGLGRQYANPVLKAKNVAYKAPTLNGFTLGNMAQINDTGGARSNIDPGFLNLLPQEEYEEEELL